MHSEVGARPKTSASHPYFGINAARSSLPAFGKLLLEIFVGHELSWDKGRLDDALKTCRKDMIGQCWARAIDACIGSDVLKRPGSFCQPGEMRDYFVLRVIKSLQWVLETLCQRQVEDVFNNVQSTTAYQTGSSNATLRTIPHMSLLTKHGIGERQREATVGDL
jgi:hypothetical protein